MDGYVFIFLRVYGASWTCGLILSIKSEKRVGPYFLKKFFWFHFIFLVSPSRIPITCEIVLFHRSLTFCSHILYSWVYPQVTDILLACFFNLFFSSSFIWDHFYWPFFKFTDLSCYSIQHALHPIQGFFSSIRILCFSILQYPLGSFEKFLSWNALMSLCIMSVFSYKFFNIFLIVILIFNIIVCYF